MGLKDAAKEYFGLRADSFKLGMVENLSVAFNLFLSLFVLICTLLIALVFIASGFNKWLGEAMDNPIAASFITGGVFLILFIILLLLRKKLFTNTFVQMFAKMFFKENHDHFEEDSL